MAGKAGVPEPVSSTPAVTVSTATARPRWFDWTGAPQWLVHQAAWWACVLAGGWIGPASMAVFVAAHLVLSPGERHRDARLIGAAVVLGLLADSALGLSHAVTYVGSVRLGVVPLWMVALWAGFGATLRHSQRALVATPRRALLVGVLGGPAAYSGGETLGCMTVHGTLGLIAIGVVWAVVLLALHRLSTRP